MTYRAHLTADFQKSLRVSPRLSPVPSNGANHLPELTFPTDGGENNSPLAQGGQCRGTPVRLIAQHTQDRTPSPARAFCSEPLHESWNPGEHPCYPGFG